MIGLKSFWSFADAQKAFQSLTECADEVIRVQRGRRGHQTYIKLLPKSKISFLRKLERGSYLNQKDKTRSPYHLSVQQRSV